MALPDVLKPSPYTTLTTGISSASVANGSTYTGSEIDNTSNRYGAMTVEVVWSYATAPTANKTVKVHLLRCLDGTNYEEQGNQTLIAAFSPPADTASHRRVLRESVPLLAYKFKLAVENVDTAQTLTATVNAYAFNERVED